jgi:hypothetical protein
MPLRCSESKLVIETIRRSDTWAIIGNSLIWLERMCDVFQMFTVCYVGVGVGVELVLASFHSSISNAKHPQNKRRLSG